MNIVNEKMKEVIKFFSIKDIEIKEIFGKDIDLETYDFYKMPSINLINLIKKYNLSIDVLEEVFLNKENDIKKVKNNLMKFKSKGIIRTVDELGRATIPIEYRDLLSIVEKDKVEIYLNEKHEIVIRPRKKCFCCGKIEDLVIINETFLCKSCIKRYTEELKINENEV